MKLTKEDIEMILESLDYSRRNIEDSTIHPNYDSKKMKIKKIETLRGKLTSIKKNYTNE